LLTKAQARYIGRVGKVINLIDWTEQVIAAGIEAIEQQEKKTTKKK
jgi:hypothetical protein